MLEISLIVIPWIFFAYIFYRIGNKLHIKKSYPWYIIPLWNFWILAKKSEIKIKDFSLILIMTLIVPLLWVFFFIDITSSSSATSIIGGADGPTSIFIANRLALTWIDALAIYIYSIIAVATIATIVVVSIFWGSVARKMGKEYGVYVVLGLFSFYLPPLLLAFESIDKVITTNRIPNMYSPLLAEEKEVWDKENNMPKEKINRIVSIGVLVLIFSSIVYTVS